MFNCGSENNVQNTCPVKIDNKGTDSRQEENRQAKYIASDRGRLYAEC